MKLECCRDGAVYASRGRTVLRDPGDGSFDRVGTLPLPASGLGRLRDHLVTTRPWKAAIEGVVGAFPTTNVWPVGDEALLATANTWLLASRDGGATWNPSRRLPPSSGTAGVLPTGVCHHEGTTYLGEYPLDHDATPRILRSTDGGATWRTLTALPSVRHVHSVQADPYTGDVWVTTGDTDEECRIGRLRDGEFEPVGGGSQAWRAVELVFAPGAVLWGMDCSYADRNRLFALDRDDVGGEPREVGALDDSIYYGESIEAGGTTWAVFSTAAETGIDTTAPEEDTGEPGTAAVVAASAASGFEEWHELAAYRKHPRPADGLDLPIHVPSAGAYVYLASDPDRGLFFNPYNTATHHGRVRQLSTGAFERLADDAPAAAYPR